MLSAGTVESKATDIVVRRMHINVVVVVVYCCIVETQRIYLRHKSNGNGSNGREEDGRRLVTGRDRM